MRKVRKDKVRQVAKSLLEGSTFKQALLDNNYSVHTANNGGDNKVIQEALDRNNREMRKRGITPEQLLDDMIEFRNELRTLFTNSKNARDRKDWASRLQSSIDTLARHTLSTKSDSTVTMKQDPAIDSWLNTSRIKDLAKQTN